MKKQLLVIALITGLLVGLGTTAAQAVDHELEIVIPAVLQIRFVDAGGLPLTEEPNAVVFLPSPEAIAAGTTGYAPVSVTLNWADIEVFANSRTDGFEITVETDNAAFEWDKVQVTPDGGDIGIAPFPLPVNDERQLFESTVTPDSTNNLWRSLGIGPDSYWLTLNGMEAEGDYSTTVTYTIADL